MDLTETQIYDRCTKILSFDEFSKPETERICRLAAILTSRGAPPDDYGLYPDYDRIKGFFLEKLEAGDTEKAEEGFLDLYCHLHGYEAPYTKDERKRVDETGGYWCHAGGLSPIIKAAPWIGPESVTADFGAGNGLQGLCFQKLYPHRNTVQVEISSKMVQSGRQLQEWLGIEPDRVDWIIGDVCDTPPLGMDFIYLYRPLKPVGPGIDFYSQFAEALAGQSRHIVIFSIADCLKDFLPQDFRIFYTDGHLTCFRNFDSR